LKARSLDFLELKCNIEMDLLTEIECCESSILKSIL